MCRSAAEGGQRCAAHTRPRFEKAIPGTSEWDEAAADFASSKEGHDHLNDVRFNARMTGQFELEAAASAAIRRGNNRRLAANEIRDTNSTRTSPLVGVGA